MRLSRHTGQTGSATIVALIVVSLVAMCVTTLIWQQNFAIRKLEIYKSSTQVFWLQHSLIDVIRLVLRIDVQNDPNIDHLGEIWALPLENSKVQDYLKTEELPEDLKRVQFSGSIQDAQSMFNIANLWDASMTVPNLDSIKIYTQLLQQIGIDSSLAEQTVKHVINSNSKPQFLDDLLNIPGYTPEIINLLSPFVILLPEPTTINMNTVSLEVFKALFPLFSTSEAEKFMLLRTNTPLKSLTDLNQVFGSIHPNQASPLNSMIDVKSNYFLAHTAVRIDKRNISSRTLIKRFFTPQVDRSYTSVIWTRQKTVQVE